MIHRRVAMPMNTTLPSLPPSRSATAEPATLCRQPHFECSNLSHAMQLSVFVPGVEPAGIEITTCGPDLVVRGRKARPVRVNWPALNLEAAQRDYELKLRLGLGLDFDRLRAEFDRGILRIVIPKRVATVAPLLTRRVA